MDCVVGEAVKSRTPDMIAAEIEWISGLSFTRVRALWRTTFRKEVAKDLSRNFLVRMLAWHIQQKAFGGHNAATLRLLGAYGRHDSDKVELFRRLKAGSSVVREYQGVRYIVTIGDNGFIWQGSTYKSLSAIAREITGSKWNGPRFFGLRPRDRATRTRNVS